MTAAESGGDAGVVAPPQPGASQQASPISDAAHAAAVATIAARVSHFHALQKPFRLYHGSTNSTRRSLRSADNTVDTSALSRVLSVSPPSPSWSPDGAGEGNGTPYGIAVVEPNVAMDALVAATLPLGLVPPVVMEFPGITCGGGFSGTSGESSSFRFGPFDATVEWIEIVLATGEVVPKASRMPGERPDIFWGAASAFGTLGVVTALAVRLIKARPWVQLKYELVQGSIGVASERIKAIVDAAQDAANGDDGRKPRESGEGWADYVDGIVFSPQETLVCVGRMVDSVREGGKTARFDRARDEWFYTHAKKVARQLRRDIVKQQPSSSGVAVAGAPTATFYVPLWSYLFRYDRGAFWSGRYAFTYFAMPFNRVTRTLLDPFMHTRAMYRALHSSGLAGQYMIQDVGVPYSAVPDFAAFLHENLNIYPLWLCPLKISREGGPEAAGHGLHACFADSPAEDGSGLAPEMINFGVWGPIPTPLYTSSQTAAAAAVDANRALEAKVAALRGMKWLYAQCHYTEDEFWRIYDRPRYDALRERVGATYLPSVWDKVHVDSPLVTGEAGRPTDDGHERGRRTTAPWRVRALTRLGRLWPLRGLWGVWNVLVGQDYLLRRGGAASPN